MNKPKTREARYPIPETILQQLGGRRLIAMTGAHSFSARERELMFALPACRQGINKVRIELTPQDLYRVSFYRLRKQRTRITCQEGSSIDDVDVEGMRSVFTSTTGLALTL